MMSFMNRMWRSWYATFVVSFAVSLLLLWLFAKSGANLGASLNRTTLCDGAAELIRTCRQGVLQEYDVEHACTNVTCTGTASIPKGKSFLPSCEGRYGQNFEMIIRTTDALRRDGPCRRGGQTKQIPQTETNVGQSEAVTQQTVQTSPPPPPPPPSSCVNDICEIHIDPIEVIILPVTEVEAIPAVSPKANPPASNLVGTAPAPASAPVPAQAPSPAPAPSANSKGQLKSGGNGNTRKTR